MNGEGGIFSLYDTKAEAFLPTFNAPTNAVAIRVVSNMVNGGNDDVICKHPDDFSLFRLGTINLNDGTDTQTPHYQSASHSYHKKSLCSTQPVRPNGPTQANKNHTFPVGKTAFPYLVGTSGQHVHTPNQSTHHVP